MKYSFGGGEGFGVISPTCFPEKVNEQKQKTVINLSIQPQILPTDFQFYLYLFPNVNKQKK